MVYVLLSVFSTQLFNKWHFDFKYFLKMPVFRPNTYCQKLMSKAAFQMANVMKAILDFWTRLFGKSCQM